MSDEEITTTETAPAPDTSVAAEAAEPAPSPETVPDVSTVATADAPPAWPDLATICGILRASETSAGLTTPPDTLESTLSRLISGWHDVISVPGGARLLQQLISPSGIGQRKTTSVMPAVLSPVIEQIKDIASTLTGEISGENLITIVIAIAQVRGEEKLKTLQVRWIGHGRLSTSDDGLAPGRAYGTGEILEPRHVSNLGSARLAQLVREGKLEILHDAE